MIHSYWQVAICCVPVVPMTPAFRKTFLLSQTFRDHAGFPLRKPTGCPFHTVPVHVSPLSCNCRRYIWIEKNSCAFGFLVLDRVCLLNAAKIQTNRFAGV